MKDFKFQSSELDVEKKIIVFINLMIVVYLGPNYHLLYIHLQFIERIELRLRLVSC